MQLASLARVLRPVLKIPSCWTRGTCDAWLEARSLKRLHASSARLAARGAGYYLLAPSANKAPGARDTACPGADARAMATAQPIARDAAQRQQSPHVVTARLQGAPTAQSSPETRHV